MKTASIRLLLFLFIFALPQGFANSEIQKRKQFDYKSFELIAIQDRGRIKPLHTFAKETLEFVTGRASFFGLSSSEILLHWLTDFENGWAERPMILVNHKGVKQKVGLPVTQKYFTINELRQNPTLGKWMREIGTKTRKNEDLTDLEKKGQTIQGRIGFVQAAAMGRVAFVLPNPEGVTADWFSLASLSTDTDTPLPYDPEQRKNVEAKLQEMIKAFLANDKDQWKTASADFANYLRTGIITDYPSEFYLKTERHFNNLRPFRWAWISYVLAFILLLGYHVTQKIKFSTAGIVFVVIGFLLNTYGFALRCYIAQRPPVTNMYESVIWVTWGCILFALIIYAFYKKRVILTASTVFAFVSLILADYLPNVLDPGIHPLEPVLRSNFWLTIHVLTITLSYAAFALSLCLGNVVMGYYIVRPKNVENQQFLTLYMYRAIQIGVILLAAGTILGGVWADYSWGRFWGWDPKEVWALIALLLYLAVLHGRFTGWLKSFGFVNCTIFCFLGVLMAWYGVNFVLGAGLHSYGFGSGGLGYVLTYVILQSVFNGVGLYRLKTVGDPKKNQIFPKGTR